MAFTQLNPQIPLRVQAHGPCPGGGGQAIAVVDYSEEHDLKWVIILDDGGAIWTVANRYVTGYPNCTMGRYDQAAL